MRNWLIAILLICFAGLAFAQPGETHLIIGSVNNPDGSPIDEACLSFVAWIDGDSSEVLTEESTGCGVEDNDFYINSGNLTGAVDGATMRITFFNTCTDNHITVSHVINLDYVSESIGIINLEGDLLDLSIEVTNPNGGEVFFQEASIPIRWSSTGAIDDVMIEYSSDGGASWNVIIAEVVDDGDYGWTAPILESDEMLIKVSDSDSAEIFDVCDDLFSIIPPEDLDLLYPVGGERFIIGNFINIEWESVSLTGTIDILFSSNDGVDWDTVQTDMPLSDTYNWEIPNVISEECIIRVENAASELSDQNDVLFEIDTLDADETDTIPPADIDDLAQVDSTYTSVTINLTATGDDGYMGNASEYDLRVLDAPITEENWDEATSWPGFDETPLPSGELQEFVLGSLDPGSSFYIAMKIADEVPNWSGISNTILCTTPEIPDETPPDPLVLMLGTRGCAFAEINWIATGDDGDDGTADYYDFRLSEDPITDENFEDATIVEAVPEPEEAGTEQMVTIHDLEEMTDYYFAAKVYDEAGNASALSNVLHYTTPECVDTEAPGACLDLGCRNSGTDYIELSWTAPGDDGYTGFADHYELYYDDEPITMFNYHLAPQHPAPPEPVEGGETQVFRVDDLDPAKLYYFAIMTFDEAGHRSRFGHVAACWTNGVLEPLGEIVKTEDDPDFYLPYMTDIFFLEGAEYEVESTVEEVTVTLEESDLLEEMDARVLVSLEENYFGDSWIILRATNDRGDTLVDSVSLIVEPYDDAPIATSDMPDSIIIEGHIFDFELEAYDIEDDSIIYVPVDVPSGFTISPDGELYWDPGGSEGAFEISIGLTNEGCLDTNLFEFPLQVVKMTHPMFQPQNLEAHDGFTGSIPITWDIPQAMSLDLPVTLAGYTLYRSNNFEYGYEVIATDIIFNSFNDCYIEYGETYYYKVAARYVDPDDMSGFSNTDAGFAMISGDIYSSYVRDWATIDGILDDAMWDNATFINDIHDGIDIYVSNNDLELYLAVVVEGSVARGGEFNMFFDDNRDRMWPDTLETEGLFRSYDAPGVNNFFVPYTDDDGLVIGVEEVAYEMSSEWSFDGMSIMEARIDLSGDSRMQNNPGDTIGIVFELITSDEDTAFRYPLGADHEDPRYFGKLILGAPGGGSPRLSADPPFINATIERDWTDEQTLTIRNFGDGIAVIDAVTEDAPWLLVTPRDGLVYPHTSRNFELFFRTEDMAPGTYETVIVFYTNDPEAPELRVDVTLVVEEHSPENYFTLTPPYRTDGEPGTFVTVPIRTGIVYDNEITSLEFSVECDPENIFINNAEEGTELPADWTFEMVYLEEGRVDIEMSGETPLLDSARIADIRFGVREEAIEGASSFIRANDVIINGGVELPEYVPTDGIFVIGDELDYYWLAQLSFVGEGGTFYDSLYFGTLPHATGNYDRGIDMYNLFLPPGTPDAYFISDDFVKMQRDIRRWGDTIIVWQATFTEEDGWIKWNPDRIWPGIFIDDEIEMTTDSMYYVGAGDTVWFYYHHNFEATWHIDLSRGWNMISVPIELDDMSFETLFPSCLAPGYVYAPLSDAYASADTLEHGKGYWVLSTIDTSYEFSGKPIYRFESDLQRGWNMIGSVVNDVYFWEQRIEPVDALLEGDLWTYIPPPESRYDNSEVLETGIGYWVFAFEPAEVFVSSILGKNIPESRKDIRSSLELRLDGSSQYAALRTVDSEPTISHMPPIAPDDVNSMAIDGKYAINDKIDRNTSWTVDIQMQEAGRLYMDIEGDYAYAVHKDGEEIFINKDKSIELREGYHRIEITTSNISTIPSGFAISSIKPNPGNSNFAITFEIAEEADVDLSVYDLSGRKLRNIENGRFNAGKHTVRYHEDNLDSGVYFVRLKASEDESIKKLMLIK